MNESNDARANTYRMDFSVDGGGSLSQLARRIQPGTTILELGPASGYLTRYLHHTLGCTVDCVEYSADMAREALPYCRDMWVANLDDVDLASRFESAAYDYVIAADVLEHLIDPWRMLSMCRHFLKPGTGRLLLSVPNVGHLAVVGALVGGSFEYRSAGLLDRTHLRFFTRKTLLAALRAAGYRVEDVDFVHLQPEQMELMQSVENLPTSLDHVYMDSLVYQFVVVAAAGEMSEAEWKQHLSKPTDPTSTVNVELFWARRNETFISEQARQAWLPMLTRPQQVSFDLPAGCPPHRLRLDPSDWPRLVAVHHVKLLGQSGKRLWEASSAREVLEGATARALYLHVLPGNELALRATDMDPSLVFELDDVALGPGPWSVEVELSYPLADNSFANTGMLYEKLERVCAENLAMQARVRELTEQMAERDIRLGELHRELSLQVLQCRQAAEEHQKLENSFYSYHQISTHYLDLYTRAAAQLKVRRKVPLHVVGNLEAPVEIPPGVTLIVVSGWVHSNDQAALVLSAQIDNEAPVPLRYGLSRPDVAACYPEVPHAGMAGFSGILSVPPAMEASSNLKVFVGSEFEKLTVFVSRCLRRTRRDLEPSTEPL